MINNVSQISIHSNNQNRLNRNGNKPAQGLSIREQSVAKEDPYVKIAESMESQFLNHMIQEMRKSVNKENPDGTALNYYNTLLDGQRSDVMAKKGLGIKDMILKQIHPKYINAQGYRQNTKQGLPLKENIHE